MFLNTARYCNHEALEASCVVEVVAAQTHRQGFCILQCVQFQISCWILLDQHFSVKRQGPFMDQGPRNNLLSDRLSLVEGLRLATSQLAVDANLYTIYSMWVLKREHTFI